MMKVKEKTHRELLQQSFMCLVHGCKSICTLEVNCITSMATFKLILDGSN